MLSVVTVKGDKLEPELPDHSGQARLDRLA
jgi:hypothetical protein